MHADVYLGLVNDQAEVDASLAHTLFRNRQPIANDRAVWLTELEVSQAVADATALPAVERIIEAAPPRTRIRLFCEVADPRDARLPAAAAHTDAVSATWVHRSGNGRFASRVADIVLRAELATDGCGR